MGKSNRDQRARETHSADRASLSSGTTGLLTLVGVVILLVINIVNWTSANKFQTTVNTQLTSLETRISQVSTKVDSVARGQQPSRGPDPNKVYTIKMEGAPSEGPPSAPVVIAEVSDFQ